MKALTPHFFTSKDNRRYLLVLALVTGLLGLGLGITALTIWQQSRNVERSARLQADSIIFMTFQLEREFLRTRHELQLALLQGASADWPAVQRRHDILVSRIKLMRENLTVERLARSDAYRQLWPELQALQHAADPLMAAPNDAQPALRALLERMEDLGPQVQALSQVASGLTVHQIEEQVTLVRAKESQMLWLLSAQVGLLMLASLGLWRRHQGLSQEHRQMQQLNVELAQARDQAEEAHRAKSQFLANMSHELRTPFNGMLGMLHQLESSPLNPQQRDHLKTARQSAHHLLSLLNDILDLTALDSGRLKVQTVPFQMRALIEELEQWMQPLVNEKGLSLTLHMDRECPPWVWMDPSRVRQILLNLLSNAVKFTERGGITVEVHTHWQDPVTVQWVVDVCDTGKGMDAQTLARVFERFVRADDSLTRAEGGTGLGLEISRTLARRMEGDITASSVAGQGSCFRLVLPTALAPAPTPACAAGTGPSPGTAEPPGHWHVLVAEDNPVNRKVLGTMLGQLGHQVSFAEDGVQALAMARDQSFDLVLMDIHMPNMNGLDSARAIRGLPGERSRVPIIAVTADVMDNAQERSLQAGMDDFIAKPIEPRRLEQAMRACIRHIRSQASLAGQRAGA